MTRQIQTLRAASIGLTALAALTAGAALMTTGMGEPAAQAQEGQRQGPPPARVEVAAAQARQMARQMKVPGSVVSRNDSQIASEISGRLTWIADEGTRLETGDTLARIDDRAYRLTVRNGEAEIKRLEALLIFQNQELDRLEELAQGNYTPTSRVEEAISNRAMTLQQLEQAKVALERAELDLERTVVRAPFPGRVVRRLAQTGEFTSPGGTLVRLVDTTHAEVRAQVPVDFAASLRDGMTVTITQRDQRIETPLRAIIPVGDEVTRTMEIRATMPMAEWIIGAAVQLGLPIEEPRTVVAVPRDALILRPGHTYVWKVDSENTASQITVDVGAAEGSMIEVAGDLADGDRVIIRGGERLRPGQPLDIAGIEG